MKLSTRFLLVLLVVVAWMLVFPLVVSAAQTPPPPSEQTFWSKLVEQLLVYFVPVLAASLAGLGLMGFRVLWLKFSIAYPNVAKSLEWAATTAVKAAEQAGAAGIINDKKIYALDSAERLLAAKGLTIDLQALDAAVEAAVWEQFNKDKQPAVGTWDGNQWIRK